MKNVLAVAALVLLASVVTGRETLPPVDIVRPLENRLREVTAAPDDVDVLKIVRARRSGSIPDLFAGEALPVPAAPVPVLAQAAPQPAPSAPPLPFTYLGRMKNGERAIVYLRRNQQEMLIVEAGATLDNLYVVEGISDSAVNFTYLPLGTAQVLPLPAVP